MSTVTHKGTPVTTIGTLPAVGSQAPDFSLTRGDLTEASLKDFAGKKKILNIVPSLDTGTCALSAKAFEAKAGSRADTVVLNISCDLPFAQARFCKAEGLTNIVPLSQMRDRKFGEAYGVTLTSGKLAGIFSRAVVVLDENNRVVYTEQVAEIAHEPNYDAALKALG